MEIILYIFVIIFFLLLVGLAHTFVKDFKEIVLGLVSMCQPRLFRPITWVTSPIWFVGYGLEKAFGWNIIEKYDGCDGLEKYPSTGNLKLDFSNGDKIILTQASKRKAESVIRVFLEFYDGDLKFENFKISGIQNLKIDCPNQISFFDFSILTQHFCNEEIKSWGIFKSSRVTYYSYSNKKTFHNIVGQTTDRQKFSIYTLDDLNKDQYLRLNQNLEV
ncbi:hypothetical protein [Maribacter flavus]|uniref:Uncharacterized protein n=1 Tax=Maribacter flavus TaxID=1658664 RepID=A0A5B2TXV4_9FLAO|nr:hypothetical protein [Maribacter flavus]KAA2219172.1 hypothetical protein F0361_06050 [Maribacter flavus]